MKAPTSYEAYCPSCRVSHPPGTRHCVHCGGGVLRERPDDAGRMREGEPTIQEVALGTGAPGTVLDPEDLETAEQEAAKKPAGLARVILSLVWIAVAVGISVYRGCQGGG